MLIINWLRCVRLRCSNNSPYASTRCAEMRSAADVPALYIVARWVAHARAPCIMDVLCGARARTLPERARTQEFLGGYYCNNVAVVPCTLCMCVYVLVHVYICTDYYFVVVVVLLWTSWVVSHFICRLFGILFYEIPEMKVDFSCFTYGLVVVRGSMAYLIN